MFTILRSHSAELNAIFSANSGYFTKWLTPIAATTKSVAQSTHSIYPLWFGMKPKIPSNRCIPIARNIHHPPGPGLCKMDDSLAGLDGLFETLEKNKLEADNNNKSVHDKKKGRNKRNQDNDKTNSEDQKKRKVLKPNYFVGIPVTNPEIHKRVVKFQEQLLASQPALAHCLVDVASLHITLFVMHLEPNEVPLACSCLDQFSAEHCNLFSKPPITLKFRGVGHFRNQVVFADLCPDEGLDRLRGLRQAAFEIFINSSLAVNEATNKNEQWCPHLTVAKLSKLRTSAKKKKQEKVRRIEPSWYTNFADEAFGSCLVTTVQLLAMAEPKDTNRYYHCERCFQLVVESTEEVDHTECCFPRRPTVQSSEADATSACTKANVLDPIVPSVAIEPVTSTASDETARDTFFDKSAVTSQLNVHTSARDITDS